jgi:hypothetical protein
MTDDVPGSELWVERTEEFERVCSVATTLSQTQTANWIADQALVSEATARSYLEQLVELHILQEDDHEDTSTYQPDPLYAWISTLRELLDDHNQEGLREMREELQEHIQGWQNEYNVESPSQLCERVTETDDEAKRQRIQKAASDWTVVEYRLSIVEDAIKNYAAYNDCDLHIG